MSRIFALVFLAILASAAVLEAIPFPNNSSLPIQHPQSVQHPFINGTHHSKGNGTRKSQLRRKKLPQTADDETADKRQIGDYYYYYYYYY